MRFSVNARRAAIAPVALAALIGLGSCAAGPSAPLAGSAPAASSVPSLSPSSAPTADVPGPEESFRAWLAASRKPDVGAACAALTPALQARMIAELNAGGAVQISTCEGMIAATAALYRATGDTGEVDVTVQDETATKATLFVTYIDDGDCGTVVMERQAGAWIITEQSQECGS